jgi:hypothetical protein
MKQYTILKPLPAYTFLFVVCSSFNDASSVTQDYVASNVK